MNQAQRNEIIKRDETNWIKFTMGRYSGSAKVFEEASDYGIGGGRVSKLSVLVRGKLRFNYDRGLDFDTLPPGVLVRILSHLCSSNRTDAQ